MNKFAVIVAGGSGTRMGSSLPKQFLSLLGKPILWYTINTFLRSYTDMQVILVLPKEHLGAADSVIPQGDADRIIVTEGGHTRFHSVQKGLQHITGESVVFVHDGVRCLLTSDLVHRCYEATLLKGNAVPAVRPVDSLRLESPEGNSIIDRNHVRVIQTPQTFKSDLLLPAFRQEYNEAFTDEASVAEQLGVQINIIEGEVNNIKITRPVDILVAEKILEGAI